jgi:maleamate amidohydrolase
MEEGPHWDNLRDVGRRYADVMKLDVVIDYLRGRRRMPLAAVK